MNNNESSPSEIMAIMFLAGVLFTVAFIIWKPHFAALEYAINKAEARIAVSACPPFKKDVWFIKKLVCPSPRAVVTSRDALAFDKLYGTKKINLEYSFLGNKKPAYFLIDGENKKSYAPEMLYQIYFWYNYAITWIIVGFMFWFILKIYAKKIDRVNIKELGFVQELLYKEAPIQTRPSSSTADGKIFDIMDYLIPKIHTLHVETYVNESLRISSKIAHVHFEAAGQNKLKGFLKFVNQVEELRKEAVAYYEKMLSSNNFYKYIGGDTKKYTEIRKEYVEFCEIQAQKGTGLIPSFSDFLKSNKNITDPGLGDEKATIENYDRWRDAKETDFEYAALLFLNLIPYNEGIFEKKAFFVKNIELNPIKTIYTYFGYSSGGKYGKYVEEEEFIHKANGDLRDGENTDIESRLNKLNAVNADLLKEISNQNYFLEEDLLDYVKYIKFYHKPTKQNRKNKPLPIVFKNEKTGEARTKEDVKKLLLQAPSPILPQRDPKKKKTDLTPLEKLEDTFESHYYPDDLNEQYGRILPLPIYIMTPIRGEGATSEERKNIRFKDAQGNYTFKSICGSYFLEVFLSRTLFGFEKNAKDTVNKMLADAKSITDPAEKDVLLKLAEETKKQLDPKNQAARAKIINEMLSIYHYEETFLVALLAYGRKILNMPVGILSGKTKRLNPALFYAITALGRTYTFNISYPISVYYEYEKRQAPERLARERNEEALASTEAHVAEQNGQIVPPSNNRRGPRREEVIDDNVEEKVKPLVTVSDAGEGRSTQYYFGGEKNNQMANLYNEVYVGEDEIDIDTEIFSNRH